MSREKFWFFHPFRVRYSEIDGQGVVFNAHYLTYFDTTITEYFRALGYDQYADAKQTGEDFHIVKSLIEYKAPVRFDWELDVGGAWRGSAIQASPSSSPSSSRAARMRS
jgi:acyl-CoA thioester hydrolase